jgi:hypothetical protein
LLPYLDLAYQGYGEGIEQDAFAVRALADSGMTFFVANSFSKSMSLYGERAGALSVVCADAAEADLVLGQLKATVRRNYSSPAIHAAGIVSRVLTDDPALRASGKPTWPRCANASSHAAQPARRAVGPPAGARLRLFSQPARHVQLHGPERDTRWTACARSSACTWCARAACAWPG